MAIDYAGLAATAKRLIGDNGVTFQITRPGAITRDANGLEVVAPAVQFSAVGVITTWSFSEQVGGIKAGEIKMCVAADAAIHNGDVFTAMIEGEPVGEKYRVVNANPVQPGGKLLVFKPRMVQI